MSLFQRSCRIKSGRHQDEDNVHACPRQSLVPRRNFVNPGEHTSASRSKTRTPMEAEFEVRPSGVRSSHKLASCRGRQHSRTAPIWILEAWTRANLAQPDGKCRERATYSVAWSRSLWTCPVVRMREGSWYLVALILPTMRNRLSFKSDGARSGGRGVPRWAREGSERRVAEWCGAQGGWRWRDISFNLNETRINDVKSFKKENTIIYSGFALLRVCANFFHSPNFPESLCRRRRKSRLASTGNRNMETATFKTSTCPPFTSGIILKKFKSHYFSGEYYIRERDRERNRENEKKARTLADSAVKNQPLRKKKKKKKKLEREKERKKNLRRVSPVR
ncbi:hypothetical protein PUN28_016809 [Cardiocondyla obscurior]|uniref:Uncharacterized protein n=1 Tax=Cardiocondyla obscurior TaxID=286306 RepID=A0AAW2ER08_9HYME